MIPIVGSSSEQAHFSQNGRPDRIGVGRRCGVSIYQPLHHIGLSGLQIIELSEYFLAAEAGERF
jgi:hypothetical protein